MNPITVLALSEASEAVEEACWNKGLTKVMMRITAMAATIKR